MASTSADPFFYSEIFSDIIDMTMEERGQYFTLLCLQHQKGHLSENSISVCVGSVSEIVISKFTKDGDGNYFSSRLESESSNMGRKINKEKKDAGSTEKIKKEPMQKAPKVTFAEFVSMTDTEYSALIAKVGVHGAMRCVEILDNYKGSSGKKYLSDYRAILSWVIGRYREDCRNRGTVRGQPAIETPHERKKRLLEEALARDMEVINSAGQLPHG